jgi:hypothetical protein
MATISDMQVMFGMGTALSTFTEKFHGVPLENITPGV